MKCLVSLEVNNPLQWDKNNIPQNGQARETYQAENLINLATFKKQSKNTKKSPIASITVQQYRQ